MNTHARHRGRLLLWGLIAGVLVASPAWVAAQRVSDQARAGLSSAESRLKSQIESRFTVVPTRGGIILVPRVARSGVQSIEIAGGGVAIDGRLVTGAELRSRLGSDAEAVAALSYVGADRLQAIFLPRTEREVAPAELPEEPAAETPPAPEEPAVSQRGEQTRTFRRETESRVAIGRTVRVEADERVRNAVVVIGGSAYIDGYVGDAVVVVGGIARLGRDADVRGDVVVVGGSIDRQPGARVSGEVNVVDFGMPDFDIDRLLPKVWFPRIGRWGPSFSTLSMVGTLTRFAVFGLILAFLLLIAGRGIGRIERTAVQEPWKAGMVGLLAELVMVPLIVLTVLILVVSIVGIPLLLLVPFAVLVIIVGFFLGFAGVAVAVGRVVTRHVGGGPGVFAALLVGLAAIWGLTLIGRLVMLAGWPAWSVASLVLGVGFVLEYVAWTVGFGAALLSRFGARDRHPAGTPNYGPPPPPPAEPDLSLDGLEK